MKINVLFYIFKVLSYTYFHDSCNACGASSYCTVEQWASWSSCNATCGGGGVQERQKVICCDTYKYTSLNGCLQGCSIPFSWWQANAIEHKTCGKCQRGGTFDVKQNTCICPSGYGGSCCDLRTTLSTTMKTTTTRTTTTIPTTTKTTTKPTTTKTTTITTTTKTTTILSTKQTTTIPTTTRTTTIPTTTKTTTIPTTTKTTTKSTTMKTTTMPTTTRTTTIPTTAKTTIIPTTTNMRKTTTKPTAITITKPASTKRTTILSTTKTIPPWAIVVISVSCLVIVLLCCCCLWYLVGSYKKKDRVTKFKPAEENTCCFDYFSKTK